MSFKKHVLFVCTQNSARSQMAEGWLRHLAGDAFEVASAGVEPGQTNPFAVKAMAEAGVDISAQKAEGIDAYLGVWPVSYLIVVCSKAGETCPTTWPNILDRFHWFFDDPAAVEGTDEEKLASFRRVRDEIKDRIEVWLVEQGLAEPSAS